MARRRRKINWIYLLFAIVICSGIIIPFLFTAVDALKAVGLEDPIRAADGTIWRAEQGFAHRMAILTESPPEKK